jgi:hypothetical protein
MPRLMATYARFWTRVFDAKPFGTSVTRMPPACTVVVRPSPVRRFVDYFAVSPARDARGP